MNSQSCITSLVGLSSLSLLILGNLNATPDLCLVLELTESKATSITKVFSTSLTGPNFLIVLLRTNLSKIFNSLSLNPKYAFPIGESWFPSHKPKVKSE